MDSEDISFDGLETILGAEFTLSRGVSPSICTLFFVPQEAVSLTRGPLRFSFGSQEIVFPDMTPDVAHIRKVNDEKWAIQLYDRRFYWKQGFIGGTYNKRLPDCSLLDSTKANARELADRLLRTLGETTHDVSRMSENVFPYSAWEGTNPALALANLLDYCSCVLCPGPTDNLVVHQLGVGADLPDGDDDISSHIPFRLQVPGTISALCGPDVFQSKLALEAVSVGVDGFIKPIANTDYAPAAGWGTDFYMFFPNVSSNYRSYAFGSMYRIFRPTGQAQGGLQPTGCDIAVAGVDQYALNDFIVDPVFDTDGNMQKAGPWMDGTFWPQCDHAINTGANTVYTGSFKINKDAGLVGADYPIIRWGSSNSIVEPTMYLTTSYSIWDADRSDKVRYRKQRNIGGSGEVILRRPELFRVFKTNYSYTSPTDTQNNVAAIDAELEEYLSMFAKRYDDPWIEDREYHGLIPIVPDGKIAQVRYRVGFGGPTTRASKNFEFDTYNVGEDERRQRETVSQLQEGYR